MRIASRLAIIVGLALLPTAVLAGNNVSNSGSGISVSTTVSGGGTVNQSISISGNTVQNNGGAGISVSNSVSGAGSSVSQSVSAMTSGNQTLSSIAQMQLGQSEAAKNMASQTAEMASLIGGDQKRTAGGG